jgi:HTH-type transcriptional regulator / antitoxin MqsA
MTSKCPVCGGGEESTHVTFSTVVSGTLISIERVPALVCRQCGKETFSAETVKRFESLLASHPTPKRVAEVPVNSLDAA